MPANKPKGFHNYRTVPEMARFIGVSSRTIKRRYAAGNMPACYVMDNGTKLWCPKCADEHMKRQHEKTPQGRKEKRRLPFKRRIT